MASAIGLSPSRKRGAEALGKDATVRQTREFVLSHSWLKQDAEKRKRFLSKLEALENRSLEVPTKPSPCATEGPSSSASVPATVTAHLDLEMPAKSNGQTQDCRKGNHAGSTKADQLPGSAKVSGKVHLRPDVPIALNSSLDRSLERGRRQEARGSTASSGNELRENLLSPDSSGTRRVVVARALMSCDADSRGSRYGRAILIALISLILGICALAFFLIQPNTSNVLSSKSEAGDSPGTSGLVVVDSKQCKDSVCIDANAKEDQPSSHKKSSLAQALNGFKTVASKIATQIEHTEDLEIKERWALDD